MQIHKQYNIFSHIIFINQIWICDTSQNARCPVWYEMKCDLNIRLTLWYLQATPQASSQRGAALRLWGGVWMRSLRCTWIWEATIHRGDMGHTVAAIISIQNRHSWYTSQGDCGGEFIISFSYCSWSDSAKKTCSYAGNWLVMEKKRLLLRKLFKEQYHYYKPLQSLLSTLCC